MNELMPYDESVSSREKTTLPLPRFPEELYGYFFQREDGQHEEYSGYSDLAAEAADAIAEAARFGRTDELKANDIALIPGRAEGIYMSEQTNASRELLELIIVSHHLEPVADETTDQTPFGRVLWQNSEGGAGINLIEERSLDDKGEMIKLTAVSHVPEDLLARSLFVDELLVSSHFRKETKAGLKSIPVIEIDEAALVSEYFRNAA